MQSSSCLRPNRRAPPRPAVGRDPRMYGFGTHRLCRPVSRHFRCSRWTGRAAAVPVLLSLYRFSDAGNDETGHTLGDRRRKSAKARNRGGVGHRRRRGRYGDLGRDVRLGRVGSNCRSRLLCLPGEGWMTGDRAERAFAGPPKPRKSTPSRSATNGEDEPRRNRRGTSRRVDGRSTDAFDVYRRTVFGMADWRIIERWTALSSPAIAKMCLGEF